MVDIVEIYVHWYAGRSKSQVSASLGVDRKTIRKYLAPAEAAGITPGGPPMSEADWAKLLRSWFPELASRRLNQLRWAEIEPHRDYVKSLLETTTVTTIHQRLGDEGKLKVSLSTFRRWVHENLPEEAARSRVTVLRESVEPDSEAQIDYGFLGQWINPASGKRHRIWAFVMVLPASRHMFVRPVAHMDQHAWTEAHAEAFRFFGGIPRRLVPDNLKTGVDKPDLYDPQINKSYAELASHYGTLVDPARAAKPKDKPRSGPCPMSATRTGAGGRSPRWSTCRSRPCSGRETSPVSGSAGRWTARSRCLCSRQWRPRPCFRCRPSRSCWPDG
ncbi:hypothetical protein GCM10010228_58940 [Streptomyces massasporeus]|nr:hypothetical protein GCM10010228_58940 [Streptomyces massasporeus]